MMNTHTFVKIATMNEKGQKKIVRGENAEMKCAKSEDNCAWCKAKGRCEIYKHAKEIEMVLMEITGNV